MNLPNKITISRICMIPVFGAIFFIDFPYHYFVESGEYEAGEDNLPVGFSLPAEAEDFFLAGYAEEFGPEVGEPFSAH